MAGHRPFEELRAKMSPEQRARVDARVKAILMKPRHPKPPRHPTATAKRKKKPRTSGSESFVDTLRAEGFDVIKPAKSRAGFGIVGYPGPSSKRQRAGRRPVWVASRSEKERTTTQSFRHAAGFGKRIEYWIIGRMLKAGLDVFVPLVDDDAIDAIVTRGDRPFALVQIKARSKDVQKRSAALFAAIPHDKVRENYWFVFYSERMDKTWIMSSKEFVAEAYQNKTGKNKGLRSICLSRTRKDHANGRDLDYCNRKFEKYLAEDFRRLLE